MAMAMVKVAKFNKEGHSNMDIPAPAYLTGSSSKEDRTLKRVEARLLYLIEGTRPARSALKARPVIISLIMSAVITLSLAGAITSSMAAMPECSKEHCSVHSDALGAECKTHCEMSEHNHSK